MPRFCLIAFVLAFAACGPGEDAPRDVPTDGPIAVSSLPLDAPALSGDYVPSLDGPLRLLSITPREEVGGPTAGLQISATFSKPVAPLGEAQPPAPDLVTLDPAVPGTLRWEGTQTLVFSPTAPLQRATTYRVTLAGGIRSIDGDVLAAPTTWSFTTERPALARSRPEAGARYVSPDSAITLYFNQSLRLAGAEERIVLYRIDARGDRSARIRATVEARQDSVFVVTPRMPLQLDARYMIEVGAGLQSQAGTQPSLVNDEVRFQTYAPLRLERVTQSRPWNNRDQTTFDPRRGFTLVFSTPVRFGDLREALRVAPALDLPPGIEARDADVGLTHSFPGTLTPETTYSIELRDLQDQLGQTLARQTATFTTRALGPDASIPHGLLIVEADQQTTLPLRVTNVDHVRLGLQRLTADDIVPLARVYDHVHYYGDEGQNPLSPTVATRRIPIDAPRNRPTFVPLALDALLTAGTGIVGVHLRPPATKGEQSGSTALAVVTRMGITGKFSAHQNLILVTDLATAEPVAGARVAIRDDANRVRWTGTTDAEGRALTPGWSALGIEPTDRWERPRQYAIVEHRGDLAFTSSLFTEGIEPYRFDVDFAWWADPVTYGGSVFTDRGLYRAGETVQVKGIVRRHTDRDWASVRDSVRVLVWDARDEQVLDERFRPSDLGTFHFDFASAPDAALGQYRVQVHLASDTTAGEGPYYGHTIASGGFRVDAFRRATFAVEARSTAPSYIAGDFFEGTIEGRYLFGAAMQGQPVAYRLQRTPGSYTPPGYDGYRFGSYRYYDGAYRELAEGDTLLDESGLYRLRASLPSSDQGTATSVVLSATVTDPARQETTARTEWQLHPGLFYIGLKPRTTYVSLSETQSMPVDMVTVTPAGQPVGDKRITLTLIRQQWNSIREIGADGRLRWRSERTEETVASQQVTTQRGRRLQLDLPLPRGGSYILRAEATDVRGNVIATEAYFHASGPGYTAWERRDDDRVELIADRTGYAPGETAKIMILSPYEEATALITVEREGILSSRLETLTGSAPEIEVPLTDVHLPNAFVSVVLLNGRSAAPSEAGDPGAPSFKIGYVNLPVDAGSRHLTVEIEPGATTYEPGAEVTVELRLRDAGGDGVPGEIAFSAADAGVLNLIGYALPDPFAAFYGPRSLGVTTTETRANLIRQRNYGQKEEDMGGGGGDPTSLLRQDFRPLAHWAPAIRTDRRGRAEVTFRLPESLTTFRLMATALTAGNQFGAARTDIVVTKPLVLQPALPRFARRTDRFEAGVLVTNTTGAAGTATVTAAAQGLVLGGTQTARVALRDGETREVRFGWRAPDAGEARLTFRAELGDEQDALRVTLPVHRPTVKQTVATFASTADAAREVLRVPADHVPDLGGLQVRLASTALAGLDGAADYLFTYPYGCLEQRTSAVRPLLLADALVNAFGLEVLGGRRDALLADWVGDLDAFWTGEGFTMWRGSRVAHPFVSAYVVLAMAEAEASGLAVPEAVRREALDALEQKVRNRSVRPAYLDEPVWRDTRALMVYALARHGRVLATEIDALARLALDPNTRMGADGESFLIRTLLLADAPALAPHLGALVDRLKSRIRVESATAYIQAPQTSTYRWIFASDVRATAFGLSALIEADPTEDTRQLAQRMIRYLMNQRVGGAWASTQENAAVIEAFSAFYTTFEAVTPDFAASVKIAGTTLLETTFRGRSLDVPEATASLESLPDVADVPLAISKSGAGQLYYSLRLQTYAAGPVSALSQGLTVERTIQRLDRSGQPTGPAQTTGSQPVRLGAGDLVRVTLRVTSPTDRHYVVVDDPLPAGLEALNAAFETTDGDLVREAQRSTERRWWGSFNHTEMRDDRVVLFADYMNRGEHTYVYVARATTPGTFIHPPVQAELMYQPETNGRTATGTLIVHTPLGGTSAR